MTLAPSRLFGVALRKASDESKGERFVLLSRGEDHRWYPADQYGEMTEQDARAALRALGVYTDRADAILNAARLASVPRTDRLTPQRS
jgi:hypothetical protein